MRLRLSVRAVLVAVALVSLPLGYLSSVWRRGGFEFQRYHANVAYCDTFEASRHLALARGLRDRSAQSHSCPYSPSTSLPLDRQIAEHERLARGFLRKAEEHRRWAGPAMERVWVKP
jgi:hypothetical protein